VRTIDLYRIRDGEIVERDCAEHGRAEIEAAVEPAPGPVCSFANAASREGERRGGVSAGDVDAVGDLAREAERAGPLHRTDLERQALLHRPRGREESRVPVELALELDPSVSEEPAHDLVRLPEAGERPGALPADAVLLEHREVADGEDNLGAAVR